MSVCPVCGCKTDELDFVSCKLENCEEKVCSFCEKQIKKLYLEETPATAQIRWLSSVIAKDIPVREPELTKALLKMQEKFAPEESADNAKTAVENFNPGADFAGFRQDVRAIQQGGNANTATDEQIKSILNRLDKLEASFKKYKRSQLIKMVVELMLPVVMLILILIVFFASGLFDTLTSIIPS
ncbi:MAG: hypothetical protein IKC01_09160 [Clostridia bacterium]|nr:hypothetical protein [Clostridia bacterium]